MVIVKRAVDAPRGQRRIAASHYRVECGACEWLHRNVIVVGRTTWWSARAVYSRRGPVPNMRLPC